MNKIIAKKRKKKGLLFQFLLLGILLFSVLRIGQFLKNGHQAIFPDSSGIYSEDDHLANIQSGQTYSKKLKKPVRYQGTQLAATLQRLSTKSKDYKYIYQNKKKYPSTLLSSVCNNSEMTEFVKGYLENQHKVLGGFTRKELQAEYPLLIQWDKRWGYADYGDSCLGISGCAPTCVSMVSLMLTKNSSNTPDAVGKYAMKCGYYLKNVGTQWNFLSQGASQFGIQATELSLDKSTVFQALKNGHPIICSVRPGDFTSAGHFIVLAGIKNGKIIVLDPNNIKRSHKLWNYERLEPQIKVLWSYSKK